MISLLSHETGGDNGTNGVVNPTEHSHWGTGTDGSALIINNLISAPNTTQQARKIFLIFI